MASADSETSRPPGNERDSQALSCLQKLQEPGATIQAEHAHLSVTMHVPGATAGHRSPAMGRTPSSTLPDDQPAARAAPGDITDLMRTSATPNGDSRDSIVFFFPYSIFLEV